MLMTIRDKAQGWIAWLIVILISVPFALWGIQEYLGVGSEVIVAKVNDREITEKEVEKGAFELRNNLRQRLGAQYNADLFEESLLRKNVTESIIRDSLIQQATVDLGLRAGDAMIQQSILSIPAFQVDGKFDAEAYKRAVNLQGMTEKMFEERLRNSLVTRQLEMALQTSGFVTDAYAQDYEKLNGQQRKISYLTLSTGILDAAAEPAEAEIKSYYDNNQAAFMAPERVKIDYIQLNLDVIAATLKASDAELQGYYEQHKSEFIAPDKKRISHILIELPEDASDEAAAQALADIQELRAKIEQGENFADVAKASSQDVASAPDGGDLGVIETGLYDKVFETAAMALKANQVSEPVRTRFGLHLITVTELIKGDADDFDAVRDQVKTAFLKTESEQVFFDYAERLSNIAYETPDSLVPASEELNLPVIKTGWLTREGGEGVLSNPKVTGAAFSEEAITQGYNSEALELSPTELLILRVTEHEAAAVKPLAEVRDTVVQQLKDKSVFEKLQQHVSDLVKQLDGGETTLQDVAQSNGVGVVSAGFITRNASNAPFAVVSSVFEMSSPKDGKPAYQAVILGEEKLAIVQLDEIKDGDVSDATMQTQALLAGEQGNDLFELYIESLRASAKVEYITK